MKVCTLLLAIALVFFSPGLTAGDAPQDAVHKAAQLQQQGKLAEAVALLEGAHQASPGNVEISSTLGFYKGMLAGKATDYMEAGKLVGEAFTLLDQAVAAAPDNPLPRFHRGILSVNTPVFLGKLDQGVSDLEAWQRMAEASPPATHTGRFDVVLMNLAHGYELQNRFQEAITTYRKALARVKDDASRQRIGAAITALEAKTAAQKKAAAAAENTPTTPDQALARARQLMQEKNWEQARTVLDKVVAADPHNLPAYRLLLQTVSALAARGYDEHIYENQDYRTKLAFEAVRLSAKVAELAPEDMGALLQKGEIAVNMPFFVNKLDQGIADLQRVLKGDSTDEQKARALYLLGLAHQKKMTTYWIQVAKKYAKTAAARDVFATLRPAMTRLDESQLHTPCVTIDFVLGFRDELAPQTAVWIEDADGEFVKTVYVSGFCGFAKEKQVDLPQWSKNSQFRDVDGVTGASIDRGHHVYVWDLKNFRGQRVKPGTYRVRVETNFWPSMMYQRTEARIRVGGKADRAVAQKGQLIPFLQVDYHAAGR